MRLIICWSGDRSRQLAETLKDQLPNLVPGLDPFISSDIGKGKLWFGELARNIDQSGAGLICLTPENLRSPWIHYEAGALAKRHSRSPGRIFTYLLGLQPSEVDGPLAAYQSTVADQEDTARLIDDLVGFMRPAERPSAAWRDEFEAWWPALEQRIDQLRTLSLDAVVPDIETLFSRKTYNEPLAECTAQSWLQRYSGALETEQILKRHLDKVQSNCEEYVSQVYTELWVQVDGYAMDLRSLLLKEMRFDLGEQGRLRIDPPGIEAACEERRRGVKRILSQLVDPRQFPAFPEAFRFDRAETWQERRHLIHRAASQLPDAAAEQPALADVNAWAASTWDFDRVMAYVVEERRAGPRSEEELASLVRRARWELDQAQSRDRSVGAEPLDYALQALRAVIGRQPVADPVAEAARSLVKAVGDYVAVDDHLEGAGSIKASVAELRAALPEQQPRVGAG